MQFKDRVKFATSTTGTGPVTVGAAETGFRTPAQAGLLNGQSFSYAIEDGTVWETGFGVYSTTGPSFTRELKASSTGSLLNLSGTAKVFFVATGAFLDTLDSRGVAPLIPLGYFSN